mgnify:CR=1 FL=1
MKKLILIIILWLIQSHCIFANTEKVPLNGPFPVIAGPHTIFDVLLKIENRVTHYPDYSINYLNELITISLKNNLDRETAFSYILLANSYLSKKETQNCENNIILANEFLSKLDIIPITSLQTILDNPTESKDKLFHRHITSSKILLHNRVPIIYYRTLSELYRLRGQYDKSNEINLIIRDQIGNPRYKREIDYLIAETYSENKDFENALKWFNNLLIEEKHGNLNFNIKDCYRKIGDCHFELKNYSKCKEYYYLANIGIDQTVTDSIMFIINSDQLSNSDNPISNEQLIKLSIFKNRSINSLEYLKIAKRYYLNSEFQSAEKAIDKFFKKKCFALFEEVEIKIIKDLSKHLMSTNKNEKALKYLLEYEALRDTISSNQNKTTKVGPIPKSRLVTNSNKISRDKKLKDNEISDLTKERELISDINLLLLIGFILLTIGIVYLRRISKQRQVANQQLELRSLRSQMNPHFIFNALNSVNSFISTNDERKANKFLTDFSNLMRTVMENSEFDFLPLSKELEILEVYLQLEHHRFKNKFHYALNIEENIDTDKILLPPMIIQPFIENSIWHGLRYKKEIGELNVNLKLDNGDLIIEIKDNGIGRVKSKEYKTKNQKKNKSIAIKNIENRIKIFEDLHHIKIQYSTSDLNPEKEQPGTFVILRIPQKK